MHQQTPESPPPCFLRFLLLTLNSQLVSRIRSIKFFTFHPRSSPSGFYFILFFFVRGRDDSTNAKTNQFRNDHYQSALNFERNHFFFFILIFFSPFFFFFKEFRRVDSVFFFENVRMTVVVDRFPTSAINHVGHPSLGFRKTFNWRYGSLRTRNPRLIQPILRRFTTFVFLYVIPLYLFISIF